VALSLGMQHKHVDLAPKNHPGEKEDRDRVVIIARAIITCNDSNSFLLFFEFRPQKRIGVICDGIGKDIVVHANASKAVNAGRLSRNFSKPVLSQNGGSSDLTPDRRQDGMQLKQPQSVLGLPRFVLHSGVVRVYLPTFFALHRVLS